MGGSSRIQKDHHISTKFYNNKKKFEILKKDFLKRRYKVYEEIGFKKEKISFLPHYLLHHYHAFYSCINKKFDNYYLGPSYSNEFISKMIDKYKKILPNGVILFDDYNHLSYEPTKLAIDKFFKNKEGQFITLPTGQSIFIKT